MKINEQLYLKKTVSEIKKSIQGELSFESFYEQLEMLDCKSLQDLSFSSDLKFFESINFILSVITTIVTHPHISSNREHIILRSDQVSSLQSENFLQTVKDPSLWKHNQQKEMVPEYVHYYQHIDELKIYENIFIIMLIDMIDVEMVRYNEFYSMMIKSYVGENHLSLSDDDVQIAFESIEKILKKIRKIKDTYFYKTITKGGYTRLSHITPTNILLKDRLYNYCFKFYRQMISYEDKSELVYDFATYYYILLLRALKKKGFELNNAEDLKVLKQQKINLSQSISLVNDEFKIDLTFNMDHNCFELDVFNKAIKKNSFNLLYVDVSNDFTSFSEVLKTDLGKHDNLEAVNVFNKCDESLNSVYINIVSEQQIMDDYLDDKIKIVHASSKLYQQFCPVCKNKTVEERMDGVCECSECNSSYIFKKNEDELWFIKLKRC